MRYLGAVLLETLGSLIPVGAHSLGCELDLLMPLVYYLAQAKVRDLHLSIVENDILRLQVVMDDLLLALIQIFEPTQDLGNNQLSLLLGDLSILLEVEVEIWPRAQLKNGAEAIVIDLDRVELLDDSPVI
jgi:hypothetical protein